MIANTYTERRKISMNEAGPSGYMTPASVMSAFQHIVTEHTNLMGIGFDDVRAIGIKWVIVKLRMEISRMPKYCEEAEISTWTAAPSKLRFGRSFEIRGADGELCVGAYSDWCILSRKDDALVTTDRLTLPYSEHRADRVCGRYRTPRLTTDENDFCHERVMRYCDLDLNGHVNNIAYIRAALDCFSAKELSAPPESFEMAYKLQCYEGETLRLYRRDDGKKTFIEGKKPDGSVVFTAAVNY